MRKEQEIFDELADLCKSKGYAHAIAFFCFRDNLVGYKDQLKGKDYAKLFSWERLIRTEISTLIGQMARSPIDFSHPGQSALEHMLAKSEALLKELHQAMMAPFTEIFKAALANPEHLNPISSAEAMREPIFYGAESAYSFQYRDLAPKKYSRDEEWLRRNKGFSIEEARKVVVSIMNFLNENAVATLKKLKDVPPEDWSVLGAFEFSITDIEKGADLPAETIEKILDAFTTQSAGNGAFTSLHEFNSTNSCPLLKNGDRRYILFQYVSLTEALYDTPFYWMTADVDYRDQAFSNRGKFTEEFTTERLRRVFGDARVFQNVDVWAGKGKKFGEIDTLVLFADRAVVIQAKSKKLTLEARKGNDLQLKTDFKGAVQDACDQALECSRKLIEGLQFTDVAGKEIKLPKLIRKVHPLCVVSDHYPALTFQAQQFLKAEVVLPVEKPLVCDVFWLDVVTEMLETPLRFLSYLELRAKAGDNVLISHENVVLGYHLKQNLWLGKYDFMHLHDDISADLDVAMAVRREGIDGDRTPPGILTQLRDTRIGRIVGEIEKRSEPASVGLGLELLMLSGKAAREIGDAIDKIASVAAKDHREHDVTVAFAGTKSGLTVHCNTLPNDAAAKKLEAHCEIRKYSQKATTWHGLAVGEGDAAIKFGVMLDYPWKEDSKLEEAVKEMPDPLPAKALPDMIRKLVPKRKFGRNERCPCGSGLKYKKCCLTRPRD